MTTAEEGSKSVDDVRFEGVVGGDIWAVLTCPHCDERLNTLKRSSVGMRCVRSAVRDCDTVRTAVQLLRRRRRLLLLR